MKTLARLLLVVVGLGPGLIAGCGGDQGSSASSVGHEYMSIPEDRAESTLARELCYLMVEGCDCSRQVFGSVEQCVDATTQQLEEDFARAREDGLVYDPECMAQQVNLYSIDWACLTFTELTQGLQVGIDTPSCKVYTGTVPLEGRCQLYPMALGDDCAPELLCVGSTCQAVPEFTPRAEGEACDVRTDACEPGTACLAPPDDPAGTDTRCTRLPGEGEACTVGCDVGLWCAVSEDGLEAVCRTPPGEGEACGPPPTRCAPGAYCEGTVCAPTLAEGEPCEALSVEACGLGMTCDEEVDGGSPVCRPEEAYVCL